MERVSLYLLLFLSSSTYADGVVLPTETEMNVSGYFFEDKTIEKTLYSLAISSSPEKVNNLINIALTVNNVKFDIPSNAYEQLNGVIPSEVSVAYIKSWVRDSRVELYISYGKYQICDGHEKSYVSYPKKTITFDLSGKIINSTEEGACSIQAIQAGQ